MNGIRYFLEPPDGRHELTFERKTPGSSGFDLHANIGLQRQIWPGRRFLFHTGLHIAMPPGVEAQVRPRSGLARDHGIIAAFGSVDSDYRGEIAVTLLNHGNDPYIVLPGDRIAQLVFTPVLPGFEWHFDAHEHNGYACRCFDPTAVSSLAALGDSERGVSGFGSTGR